MVVIQRRGVHGIYGLHAGVSFTSLFCISMPFPVTQNHYHNKEINMDSASVAVNNFLYGSKKSAAPEVAAEPTDSASLTGPRRKNGNEDTTVDEKVAPAVEHVRKHVEHEEREKVVVDKERHQDHYHTTIQPLKDQEVLPTKHENKTAPTEYREVEHDDEKIKQKVQAREKGFKDTVKEDPTVEKHVDEQTEVGEHVHHHLHETIQPVIEKGQHTCQMIQ